MGGQNVPHDLGGGGGSTSRTEVATTCSIYLSHAVFDGATPTFPEWARELRATSASSSTLTSWTSPTSLDNLSQQTSWPGRRKLVDNNIWRYSIYVKHVKIFKTSLRFQAGPRREAAVVNNDNIAHFQNDFSEQQRQYDATSTAVNCCGELLGYLIMHTSKMSL